MTIYTFKKLSLCVMGTLYLFGSGADAQTARNQIGDRLIERAPVSPKLRYLCPPATSIFEGPEEVTSIQGTLVVDQLLTFEGKCFGRNPGVLQIYVMHSGGQSYSNFFGNIEPYSWSPTRVSFRMRAYDPKILDYQPPSKLVFDLAIGIRRLHLFITPERLAQLQAGQKISKTPTNP
jgi:hypothetical protein